MIWVVYDGLWLIYPVKLFFSWHDWYTDLPMTTGGVFMVKSICWKCTSPGALAARRRITDEKLQRIVRHVVPQVITSALAPPFGEIFQQKSEIIGISVDFYGFLKTYRVRWVPLNFYTFLWVPMDFYGFLSISMHFYGFLWISMGFYGFLWIPIDFYAFLWVPMDFYGFLWIPGDCSGFLRTSMDF